MPAKISAVHERIDDIPVIIALLLKMRLVELIDQHFPTNGNRTGLTLRQMSAIWLTFILTQADLDFTRFDGHPDKARSILGHGGVHDQ